MFQENHEKQLHKIILLPIAGDVNAVTAILDIISNQFAVVYPLNNIEWENLDINSYFAYF